MNCEAIEVLKSFEFYAQEHWNHLFSNIDSFGESKLKESGAYSLFSGGKRFRPLLCFATAQSFGFKPQAVWPWALAIEMIHTYSLIHDDLPAMDNDDFRRGQPTNHKVFQEDMALLAGDALLTESFLLVAEHKSLIEILVHAAGVRGMLGGQAIDLRASHENQNLSLLENLHRKKTGALLAACVSGSAWLSGVSQIDLQKYYQFGEDLGYLFQIQDDIFDFIEKNEKEKNICHLLGEKKTQELLEKLSEDLQLKCEGLFPQPFFIKEMIVLNLKRKH